MGDGKVGGSFASKTDTVCCLTVKKKKRREKKKTKEKKKRKVGKNYYFHFFFFFFFIITYQHNNFQDLVRFLNSFHRCLPHGHKIQNYHLDLLRNQEVVHSR